MNFEGNNGCKGRHSHQCIAMSKSLIDKELRKIKVLSLFEGLGGSELKNYWKFISLLEMREPGCHNINKAEQLSNVQNCAKYKTMECANLYDICI